MERWIVLNPHESIGRMAVICHQLASYGVEIIKITNGFNDAYLTDDGKLYPTMFIKCMATERVWKCIDDYDVLDLKYV